MPDSQTDLFSPNQREPDSDGKSAGAGVSSTGASSLQGVAAFKGARSSPDAIPPESRSESESGQKKWFQSEHFNTLLDRFLSDLKEIRASIQNPLEPVEILVQNRDMAQWLKMAIAEDGGISANLRFMLPYEWTWEQLRLRTPDLPRSLPSDMLPLSVLIYEILLETIDTRNAKNSVNSQSQASSEPLEPILRTLDSLKGRALHRASMAVASQVSSVFDAYQNYRPELLHKWETESNPLDTAENWQKELWLRVLDVWKKRGFEWSPRSTLIQNLLLEASEGKFLREKPLLIFNPGLLPAPLVNLLDSMGCSATLAIYTLLPTNLKAGAAENSGTFKGAPDSAIRGDTTGAPYGASKDAPNVINPLLEAFGAESQAYSTVLGSAKSFTPIHLQSKALPEREKAPASNLLSAIQDSVRENGPLPSMKMDRNEFLRDSGVRIHSCHSPLREVESLHDYLLERFAEDPGLRPDEIAVVSPDIDTYAPFIHAVFGSQRNSDVLADESADGSQFNSIPSIPYRISSSRKPFTTEHSRLVELILRLDQEEITPEFALDVLQNEVIRSAIGFSPSDFSTIESWIQTNNVFGERTTDPEDPHELPRTYRSWESFFDRFWNGYLWGVNRGEPVNGHGLLNAGLPFLDVGRGEMAEKMVAFERLIQRLLNIRREFRAEKSILEWADALEQLQTDLLGKSSKALEEDGFDALLASLRSLHQLTGFDAKTPFLVVRLLAEKIRESKGGQTNRFTNGVVFSSMVPLRSLPFKVVCLLGLNESQFPRKNHAPDFDLMSMNPKPGERDRSREDRGLFLESLMAAGSHFMCSYIGRNAKSNEVIPPSTVLHEWLSNLRRITSLSTKDLIVYHRLNGFSRSYFKRKSEEDGLFSFHPGRHHVAMNLSGVHRTLKGFSLNGKLQDLQSHDTIIVSPDQLIAFFKSPVKEFLKYRFSANLREPSEESEEFAISYLERYHLRDHVLNESLNGRKIEEIHQGLRLAGSVSSDELGRIVLENGTSGPEMNLSSLCNKVGSLKFRTRQVSISFPEVPEIVLEGPLSDYITQSGDTSITLSTGGYKLAKADFSARHLIDFWIRQLIAAIEDSKVEMLMVTGMGEEDVKKVQVHRFPEKIEEREAKAELSKLLDYYVKGHTYPLRFFLKTAAQYQKLKITGKSTAYLGAWEDKNGFSSSGESMNVVNRILFGENAPLNPDSDYKLFDEILLEPYRRVKKEKL